MITMPHDNTTDDLFIIPPLMSVSIHDQVDIVIARDTARRAAGLLGFIPALQAQLSGAVASLARITLKTNISHEININGIRRGIRIGIQVTCNLPWLTPADVGHVNTALQHTIGHLVDSVVLRQTPIPQVMLTMWLSPTRRTQPSASKPPLTETRRPGTGELVAPERVMIVGSDSEMQTLLAETITNAGSYAVVRVSTFGEALNELLNREFTFVITQGRLPDLSGMDLLVMVKRLFPTLAVLVIDDVPSAKAAMNAFRLGAVEYLCKPLNLELVLMRLKEEVERRRQTLSNNGQPQNASPDRERRFNPETRPVAFSLTRVQFARIMSELDLLWKQVKATFVSLIDSEGNVIGTAGTLENNDLMALKRALSSDHSINQHLANILKEKDFHFTHLEGQRSGVYIIEFGGDTRVSLVLICPTEIKSGIVWLSAKRSAGLIDRVLRGESAPPTAQ